MFVSNLFDFQYKKRVSTPGRKDHMKLYCFMGLALGLSTLVAIQGS